MNASKENARKAMASLQTTARLVDKFVADQDERDTIKRSLGRVEEFIEAAVRKLPSEEAYEREKTRRRVPADL